MINGDCSCLSSHNLLFNSIFLFRDPEARQHGQFLSILHCCVGLTPGKGNFILRESFYLKLILLFIVENLRS